MKIATEEVRERVEVKTSLEVFTRARGRSMSIIGMYPSN
jgi:hypothetical protein